MHFTFFYVSIRCDKFVRKEMIKVKIYITLLNNWKISCKIDRIMYDFFVMLPILEILSKFPTNL